MEQLAQDLTVALEESEHCGSTFETRGKRWGMRRRTRSAGNLYLCLDKSGDNHSDDSSSSNSEARMPEFCRGKHLASFHQSDSDDMSVSLAIARTMRKNHALRMKQPLHPFFKGRCNGLRMPMSHSLESDSLNENSPARPNIRRKRKLKRMSIDETPVPPCGKRKRPQRFDPTDTCRSLRHNGRIKPLNQTIVDRIEKFCNHTSGDEQNYSTEDISGNMMEIQCVNENCEVASESSLSWSGGEGHEGDDELTDWAPPQEPTPFMDNCYTEMDPREIRAGCRRLRDERPGFSISTGANERVAKFLQDSGKSELRICGAERDKLGQLAALYSLDLWFEGPSSLLRKTNRTPCMQPTQRHHSGLTTAHKRIRTQDHIIS